MSWLPHGLPEREQCADSKTKHALILIGNEKNRRLTVRILEGFGYLTHTAGSHAEAVDRMARITLSVIIADVADAFPDFHEQLNRLPMTRRRLIFYALIGRELRTLYNLEALTNSVNLVIGHGELVHLEKILEVGFKDYERLFRPILEILHADYPLLS